MNQKSDVTNRSSSALADILEITESLYELAKEKVITGQRVSQKNMASINAARKEIEAARRTLAE